MDFLERYKKKMGGSEAPTSDFIGQALNKINVFKFESGEPTKDALEAVLIFKDKMGPDSGILYTYAKDGLVSGDSIIKKGSRAENDSYFLLLEETKRVDTSVVIKVFNVLETNVNIKSLDKTKPAYVKSNMSNSIRTGERLGSSIEVKKSVLVAPRSYKIKLEDSLDLENLMTREQSYSSWRVEGIDDISSPSVVYIHLIQTSKIKENEEKPELPGVEVIKETAILSVKTEDGFIKTIPTSKIISREEKLAKVQVPTGIEDFIVSYKENGIVLEKIYKVRR